MSATITADFEYKATTTRFGMWVFLAMEMLFFGGVFFLYASFRHFYPSAFAIGSEHLETELAALNTGILLTSSLTMALSVHWANERARAKTAAALAATALLGIAFIVMKMREYGIDIEHRLLPGIVYAPTFPAPKEMQVFFSLYFFATAIHALHLIIGVSWVLVTIASWLMSRSPSSWIPRIDVLGLYWHFVDVVWIFLFPLFYLIGGGGR